LVSSFLVEVIYFARAQGFTVASKARPGDGRCESKSLKLLDIVLPGSRWAFHVLVIQAISAARIAATIANVRTATISISFNASPGCEP
jgi:hypothetical protein